MVKEVIARATATVSEGEATTSNLIYEAGKSRANLIPGNTYDINAEYVQNDHYVYATGIGELEMLKCFTTTTITGNTTITLNSSLTITVTVTEDINDTALTRGTITLYDGQTIIQTSQITTSTTSITYTPSTTGTHDIYVMYSDTGGEYNNSTSNHLSVTVEKKPTTITTNVSSIDMYFGESITISGTLASNMILPNKTVKLLDYDNTVLQTTTSNPRGNYSFNYSPQNWNINGNSLKVVFEGDNTFAEVSKTIPVTLHRHTVTVTIPEIDVYADDITNIPITLEDENGDPVTNGIVSIGVTLVEIDEEEEE